MAVVSPQQLDTSGITPDTAEFVVLCFEGPDQPYSQAGGLGVRVTELSQALAEAGFRTHLIFVGDPALPSTETRVAGRLVLHRWSQWVSRYYPGGVYHGENEKLYDYNESVPPFVLEQIARPAAECNRLMVVLAEEWHTAETTCRISDLLYAHGIRNRALLLWNANNDFSFYRINWGRLSYVATITTVSKYMKHVMWGVGVNPLVIPNGIPSRSLADPDLSLVGALRGAIGRDSLLFFKIGRFDPDKRWLMAVDAAARLKQRGVPVKMVIRGGIEPHGGEVLGHAYWQGLVTHDVTVDRNSTDAMIQAVGAAAAHADLLNLRSFISDDFKQVCFRAADAVLANSGHEPFGIVGLEVMAAGGIAILGATGEDYAVSFENCVVVETEDPEEIVGYVLYLYTHPELLPNIRAEARRTASLFTWDHVIANLLGKLEYLAMSQHTVFAGRGG